MRDTVLGETSANWATIARVTDWAPRLPVEFVEARPLILVFIFGCNIFDIGECKGIGI
jgi:hypothetical protein